MGVGGGEHAFELAIPPLWEEMDQRGCFLGGKQFHAMLRLSTCAFTKEKAYE